MTTSESAQVLDKQTNHCQSSEPNPQLRTRVWESRFLKIDVALLVVLLTASAVSIVSTVYFYNHSMTNLYGDGIAHLNIARKVVDSPDRSLWQRYIQIGSPWLPLQTVLLIPLVANDFLWRSGLAGSILSMVCFVISAATIYLLARDIYRAKETPKTKTLPLLAAAIFIFNPSVVYFQSTPMTELVFMASLLVAVFFFKRWLDNQTNARLVAAGVAMTVATLARYEAWPVAAASVVLVGLMQRGEFSTRIKSAIIYGTLTAVGPVYWLWHNWAIYKKPFEFLTGPNSARGIYLQNSTNLGWAKIFVDNGLLDVALMLITVAVCVGIVTLVLGAIGYVRLLLLRIKHDFHETIAALIPVGLLCIPFIFHVLSVYRGEIQIFPLSAFGLLNVRYGLPALMPLSLMIPACVISTRFPKTALLIVGGLIALQYGWLISGGFSDLPVYQEGLRNGVYSTSALEIARAEAYLRENPPKGILLMYTGQLGPLVPRGGLTFSRIIHEGTSRWSQFTNRVPPDVNTVIICKGDGLDARLQSNASLLQDLSTNFSVVFQYGMITAWERKSALAGNSK